MIKCPYAVKIRSLMLFSGTAAGAAGCGVDAVASTWDSISPTVLPIKVEQTFDVFINPQLNNSEI